MLTAGAGTGGESSAHETDVKAAMMRVEASLAEAARGSRRPSGVIDLRPEGDRDVNVGRLRHRADIDVDLPSGSDRPLVGGVIRLAKRAVRRGLRWYMSPIVNQQSRFNHATLDLIERLRLRLVRVGDDHYTDPAELLAGYRPWFEGCRRVVHLEGTGASGTEGGAGEGVLDDPAGDVGTLEQRSVDGLFASLITKPRSAAELVALLEDAWRGLREGGVLVVETMNPQDLPTLPPSGAGPRPLHPEAVRVALVATGFGSVRLEATARQPASASRRNGSNTPSVADEVERIDDLLTYRRAVALIAHKTA